MKQTAIEWLAEKLEYVNWMRNRDEISAGMADEWRKHYLKQAKAMEKQQMEEMYEHAMLSLVDGNGHGDGFDEYYTETFKSE